MDAAQKLFTKTALLLLIAIAFLPAAHAAGVTLQANPTSLVLTSNQPGTVNLTSSTANAAFTYTTANAFFSVSQQGGTAGQTPATFAVATLTSNCTTTSPCNGTITFHPTDNGSDLSGDVTVGVTFNGSGGGGGGGNGVFNASQTSVNLAASTSNVAPQTSISLSTTSSSTITYTVGTPTQSWLTCTPNSGSVINGSPANLIIQGNSFGLGTNSYSASCTVTPSSGNPITISVTLSVGSGGGTGSGSFTLSTNSVLLACPGGPVQQQVSVSSNATSFINTTPSFTSQSWLLANGSTGTINNQSTFNGVNVGANCTAAAALGTGTFSGTVTITNSNNTSDTATINVTLSVNGAGSNGVFNPSSVTITSAYNTGIQQQFVNIVNGGTVSIPSGQSCAFATIGIPDVSTRFQVNVFTTGYSIPGTYTCNFTVLVSGVSYTYPVTWVLTGNGSGGGTGGTVSPSQLTFSYQQGSNQIPSFQQVLVNGSGVVQVTAPTVCGSCANFIQVSAASGTAPTTLFISVIGGLGVGTYSGTVNLTVGGQSVQIPVTLTVTAGAVLLANPPSIALQYTAGSPVSNTSMTVTMSDSSSPAITIQSSQTWVTVQGNTSTFAPASFIVRVDPSGLANGLNSATLTITAAGASNSPLVVPISVLVSGSSGGGTGNLALSTSALNFSTTINGPAPAAQALSVSAPSGSANVFFTVSTTTNNCGSGWLAVSPSGSLFTPQSLSVTANAPTNVSSSTTCTGTITLVSGGLTQNVQVTETIGGTSGTGTLVASPTSLTFTVTQGTGNPGVQALQITSSNGATGVTFTVNATTTDGGKWLSAGVQNGTTVTTPVTLSVSVNLTGLTPGVTYTGNISFTPTGGGTTLNVPVTLTIQSLSVSASPTSLTFNYRIGDAAPTSQNITVSGGAGLTFSATASSSGNWLSVSPTSGTTAASGTTLTVSVNPASLTTTGTQNGTIVVAGTGSATGSTTINVSVIVTAPLPTISKVTNAASFVTSTTVSAGEIITIFGTAIGPGTPVTLQLGPDGKVTTTLGGVQVLVGGYLSPLVYVSSNQVSAIVPYEIASPFLLSPSVVIKYQNQTSNGIAVTQAASAPGIFTLNSSGSGQGAILNGDNSLNSAGGAGRPANKGEIVQIYLTGEGQTNPAGVTGKVTTVVLPAPFYTPQALSAVAATVDGQPATITFSGEAPGLVSGVMQVNVQIPANARSGDLPILISIGGNPSQTNSSGVSLVTVSVR